MEAKQRFPDYPRILNLGPTPKHRLYQAKNGLLYYKGAIKSIHLIYCKLVINLTELEVHFG